jgi:ribosomal protein S18 acetylase RimI-like enzyme
MQPFSSSSRSIILGLFRYMLTFRTFRNSDPPILTSLWQSRVGQPGMHQPITCDLLEQIVFARLYFDYPGLQIALDDGRPVGFAHAGFGPDADGKWVKTEDGVTCAVVVRPDCNEAEVTAGLIERCEEYLQRRGAKVLYGGGLHPLNPFYVGLYGGSELPGILDSDVVTRQVLAQRGYTEAERVTLLQRELSGFESLIDRYQMQIRRQMIVEVVADAPTQSWWEASTVGEFDLTRFDLVVRAGGARVAYALFRNMEPGGTGTLGKTMGLLHLHVEPTYRRRGLAFFLLSEAFRQFIRQGIACVDTQLRASNTSATGIIKRLGFKEVNGGGVWKKGIGD